MEKLKKEKMFDEFMRFYDKKEKLSGKKITRSGALNEKQVKCFDEIFLKRYGNDPRAKHDGLFGEGIELLYEKEFKSQNLF